MGRDKERTVTWYDEIIAKYVQKRLVRIIGPIYGVAMMVTIAVAIWEL